MKTFTFNTLPPLQDFQFLTDSSGYVLTQAGQLYQFAGQHTTLVETPRQFTVSHFYFRDQTHGALVGVSHVTEPPIQKGDLGVAVVPLLLLLWLAWKGRRQATTRRLAAASGFLLLTSGLLLSCSSAWQHYRTPDPASPHATLLTHAPLGPLSFHRYFANKGQQSFVALTQNQGRSWETHEIPTNFYPTALASVGRNFVVGTYARPQAGAVPLHGDGDLWVYGTDATRTPQLATNTGQHPQGIRLSRGVTGLLVSARDSALYVFGSDRMPTLPPSVMSATPGNIYVLPASLQPPTRLVDTPDTVDVQSLAQARTGELWVTMAGRKPHLSHGNLGYVALPTKRLLRLAAGQWQPVTVAPFTSFEQVVFVPGTPTGYLLADTGEVLETRTNGDAWHPLARQGVRRLHPWQHAITWLEGDNRLVLHAAPEKE
ncbi:hypothetical protein GCM10022409_20920 [Hymenobacter glaciei]|uniref:Photosynthesis system II assembly factor Ycf48/Hcf136-like domain-containing protein n=1 Tax=Hymenobacter glaciei TaxID=877209 RepID=A0ABP7U6P7_9BACT